MAHPPSALSRENENCGLVNFCKTMTRFNAMPMLDENLLFILKCHTTLEERRRLKKKRKEYI